MSWFFNGRAQSAIASLEAQKAQQPVAVQPILEGQIQNIRDLAAATPDTHVVIVQASGHFNAVGEQINDGQFTLGPVTVFP